jgi:hypothetical protein
MSVGYADDEGDDGLDAITGGGQDEPAAPAETPGGDLSLDQLMTAASGPEPDDQGEPTPEPMEGAPDPGAAPGPAGAAPTDAFAVPKFDELGPLPPRPAPTGDPAKDIAALTDWTRALDDRHSELERRKGALATFAAQVGGQKGKKEAEVASVEADRRAKEQARYLAEQQKRQQVIDEAVAARVSAYKDLEGAKWDKPRTGGEIAALIFSGVGQALQNVAAIQVGATPNAPNEAAKAIAAKMEREFESKKLKLKGAGDAVLAAQYGYKTADDNHRAALNALDAEMAAKYKLVARDAADQLAQAGVPKAVVDGDLLVTENLQKAAAHEQQIHDREEQRANGAAHAKATEDLARAQFGEHKSEFRVNMGERRREFDERKLDRERADREKADAKKADKEQNLAVRDARGVIVGGAPSARVVKPIQDRLIQYDDAIKSAEDLLAYRREHDVLGALPTGDAYDRAVLAVAATTQANASDSTTAHEAGTLKKMGLVDDKAIEKTIEHLKARRDAFMKQLTPVGGGEAKGGGGRWVPVPARLAGKYKGKTELQVDEGGKVTGSR